MRQIKFDIVPYPAPRMTRSDKWKTDINHPDPKKRQRLCVHKYFKFREELGWLCKKNNYTLGEKLNIVFVLPMPETWSNKKKAAMENEPHKNKPDLDNLCKAFADSFGKDDGFVYMINAAKYWGHKGSITITEL